jgi:hypothetical protein
MILHINRYFMGLLSPNKLLLRFWHDHCHDMPSMKTFYLIKSFAPFIFLPIAPGVVQVELERYGLVTHGTSAFFTLAVQIAFTLAIIAWVAHAVKRKNSAKAFLKMSCVSKKVFYQGQWMSVEQYLSEHHNVVVSHGMTPEEATSWMRESEEWLRSEKEAPIYEKTGAGVS